MSETDIYKNRERDQVASDAPLSRKGRRRRSSHLRSFEETERRRRSKNSGLRRLLHVLRKSENERYFWKGFLVLILVLLALIGIWQFWYMEKIALDKSKESDLYVPVYGPRQTESATE